MSDISSDAFNALDTGYGQVSNPATLDSILLVMQSLQNATRQMTDQNAEMMSRIKAIENRVNALTSGDAPEIVDGSSRWKCHVCGKVLQDAATFKGHIRRLAMPSSRPKCHLNPQDLHHQRMVARFGSDGFEFHQRVPLFCRAFYGFVRAAVSAKYDDDESFFLISSWIAAVFNSDMPIPVLAGSSGSGSSTYCSS